MRLDVHDYLRVLAEFGSVILLTWTLWRMVKIDTIERRIHSDMFRVMNALKPRRDQLYVLWREWFPLEKLVYPLSPRPLKREFRCLTMSGLLPTPTHRAPARRVPHR